MAKPGGSGNAKPKPKYDGPSIDVGGMDATDAANVCNYVGSRLRQIDKMGDWAGRLVVGRGTATLKQWGVGQWGWDVVFDYGAQHEDQRAAVDAYVEWRKTL